MGRASGQTSVGTVGPDGAIYRRGRRQRRDDLLVLPSNLDPALQSLTSQLYGDEAEMLLATHKAVTSPEQLAALLGDRKTQLIAHIPYGEDWAVDLTGETAHIDLKLLGDGKVTLIGQSPGSGGIVEARGALTIVLECGSLHAFEQCEVVQTGRVTDLVLHDDTSGLIDAFGGFCELRENATAVLQRARTVVCRDQSQLHLSENDPTAMIVRVFGRALVIGSEGNYDVAWLQQNNYTTGTPLPVGQVNIGC